MGLEGGSDKAKDMSRRGFLRAAGKTAAGLGAMYAADKLGMIAAQRQSLNRTSINMMQKMIHRSLPKNRICKTMNA